MDFVFQAHRIPAPGETILGTGFNIFPGGKGANQAVMAGRLGGNPAFIGKLGADSSGAALRSSLASAGVDCKWLGTSSVGTGAAGIIVDDDGQNCIVVSAGSNGDLQPEDVAEAVAAIQPKVVLVQFEIPSNAIWTCRGPWTLIVNPAPANPTDNAFWQGVAAVVPNETETAVFTGVTPTDAASCREAARWFFDRGAERVIITLGERGCVLLTKSEDRHMEPFPVKPIDTTAAGDAFCGTLAHYVASGTDWVEAIRRANVAAALSTTKRGAQSSMPSKDEVERAAGV
jgi:ribokinase